MDSSWVAASRFGFDDPFSHRSTVIVETPSCSASCACVSPRAARNDFTRSDNAVSLMLASHARLSFDTPASICLGGLIGGCNTPAERARLAERLTDADAVGHDEGGDEE
jgi:hypothetical protein